MAKTVKPVKKGAAKKAAKPVATKKKSPARAVKKTVAGKRAPAAKATTARKKPAVKGTGKKPAGKKSQKVTRYCCTLCGYVYSPLIGEPHNGIPRGTPFEDLPDTYVCPICGQQGKGKIGKWGFEEWKPTRYLCSMCNYVYDEKRGEPHRGIKPGTKFDDLPDDYTCPVCALDPKISLLFGKVRKNGFEPLMI
ncbi:rubredoxin [Methanoregula sp.]|uniref:rubredoxin n=1 Tax=Methanoregula sp. TaxID=2052170 RepID=UPI00260DF806|nr:rubredoxin [Methanoregula sp.]MDD5143210.1 rubredoxin [Methanoregula sp.]